MPITETPTASTSEAAFDELGHLVGTWRVKDTDTDFRIEFALTAGDSVLVETWMAGPRRHSLTLYHLDGERLLATHYCPQGNQPRLAMSASSGPGHIDFEFLDATNLGGLDESHQHRLGFVLPPSGDGELERSETYLKAGEEKSDKLVLERVR